MLAEAIGKKGWESVLATNLTGGFLVSREVYGQFMKSCGGAIVNMLANVWDGMPLMAHSGAARAGIMNLTQTLALEWAPGVRVNAVAPGYVASSGLDTYDPAIAGPLVDASIRVTPLKRFAQEAEVSAAIEAGHESFACDAFLDIARRANIAVAYLEQDGRAQIAERTADFAYLRCKNLASGEPTGYSAKDIARIAGLCREWGDEGEVFAFMINGAKERAPAAAMALAEKLQGKR